MLKRMMFGEGSWFLDDRLLCRAGSPCPFFFMLSDQRATSEIHHCNNCHRQRNIKPNIHISKTFEESQNVTLCGPALDLPT